MNLPTGLSSPAEAILFVGKGKPRPRNATGSIGPLTRRRGYVRDADVL
jgi:hypothetical protein